MTEEENNDKVLSFVCPCKTFNNWINQSLEFEFRGLENNKI